MSVSILVVDDEPDVAELFRQPSGVRPARASM
jgi:CheY-like chemotaxis protein